MECFQEGDFEGAIRRAFESATTRRDAPSRALLALERLARSNSVQREGRNPYMRIIAAHKAVIRAARRVSPDLAGEAKAYCVHRFNKGSRGGDPGWQEGERSLLASLAIKLWERLPPIEQIGAERLARGNAIPRHNADFRARVAGARARGETWLKIGNERGVSRQAAQKWKDWPEVQAAEMIRGKKRGRSLHRPQRLGDLDSDIKDPRSVG